MDWLCPSWATRGMLGVLWFLKPCAWPTAKVLYRDGDPLGKLMAIATLSPMLVAHDTQQVACKPKL